MSLPAPTTDIDQAERDLKEHGICVIPNVLSKEQVDDIRALLHRSIAQDAKKPSNGRFGLDNSDLNKRVWNLLSRDQVFVDLATHPTALRLMKSVIGWPALLGNISANVALPGADAGVLHADQVFCEEPWPVNPQGCNAAWIIDDYNDSTGATRFVPGSHKLNRGVRPEEADVMGVAANCPAGSLVVFESRIWHRAGVNKSDKPRAAIFAWVGLLGVCGRRVRRLKLIFVSLPLLLPPTVLQNNLPPTRKLVLVLGSSRFGRSFRRTADAFSLQDRGEYSSRRQPVFVLKPLYKLSPLLTGLWNEERSLAVAIDSSSESLIGGLGYQLIVYAKTCLIGDPSPVTRIKRCLV